ncbi:unnamed protein product [Cunninghamella blakesleeana]
MTSMELTTSYPPSKFQADNDLNNTDVIEKYKNAGHILNAVFPEVLKNVSAGVSICDLCQYGDDPLMNWYEVVHILTSTQHKNCERGIAVPTCVSVNNYIQFVSPLLDNDYRLKAGDVVKIELGVHIDGYIATAAHTTIVSLDQSQPITGPSADVVCATHYASEAVLRMMKPGVKASEITRIITEIAAYFRCKPVENTYSSMVKRFVLKGGKDIENSFPEDMLVHDLEKYDFEIENNQAYQINIILTTGNGKTKGSEYKPFVFQRDVNRTYLLKMKAARAAFNEINEKHTVFPFSSRSLSSNQTRLGLNSLVNNELIISHPALRSTNNSDKVAQFKTTVLLTPKENIGILRTTLPLPLPYVHSQYNIPQNTTAHQVISTPSLNRIKASKGLPSDVKTTFGERHEEKEDASMDMDME